MATPSPLVGERLDVWLELPAIENTEGTRTVNLFLVSGKRESGWQVPSHRWIYHAHHALERDLEEIPQLYGARMVPESPREPPMESGALTQWLLKGHPEAQSLGEMAYY